MKLIAALTVVSALAIATPAQAQLLNSGNSGLLGLANNLLSLQTGHISVLNGGILNGTNLLSGIGLGSNARAVNRSTNTTGSNNAVAPRGGVIATGRDVTVIPGNGNVMGTGNTVVPGSGNVIGAGNSVGNQWGSNFSHRSSTRFGW